MSTGYGWEGIRQVAYVRDAPERLCGGSVYLGRYNKCLPLPLESSGLLLELDPLIDWDRLLSQITPSQNLRALISRFRHSKTCLFTTVLESDLQRYDYQTTVLRHTPVSSTNVTRPLGFHGDDADALSGNGCRSNEAERRALRQTMSWTWLAGE